MQNSGSGGGSGGGGGTILGKNLHFCFTKMKLIMKCPPSSTPLEIMESHSNSSNLPPDPQLVFKNFNSIYDHNDDTATFHMPSPTPPLHHYYSSPSPPSSPPSISEPNFSTVFASRRFFFSSPGTSNSIIHSSPYSLIATHSSDTLSSINFNNNVDHPHHHSDDHSHTTTTTTTTTPHSNSNHQSSSLINNCKDKDPSLRSPLESPTAAVKDSVAVPTYSPDPYMDFRRSMQEMVEARDLADVRANWDSLHELLLCYLALNPKSTHKFIVQAFADLLVTLLSSSPPEKNGDGGGSACSG